MISVGFPMCCGAQIIHSFGVGIPYTGTPEEKHAARLVELRRVTPRTTGLVCAIISNSQYPDWWPVLKEEGWRVACAATNPVHTNDTTCFLVVKNISGNPKPIKKKP